jgi:hypothetical protein
MPSSIADIKALVSNGMPLEAMAKFGRCVHLRHTLYRTKPSQSYEITNPSGVASVTNLAMMAKKHSLLC